MKNIALLSLALFLSYFATAQQQLSVGAKLGFASSGMSGDITGKKGVNSPVLGLVANYMFTPHFALQAEGYYIRKGGGYGIKYGGSRISDYYKFNCIEFPLLAKFTAGNTKVKFIGSAGPYFSYVTSGQHIAEDSTSSVTSEIMNFTDYDVDGVKTSRYDIGMQFGAGFTLDVGRGKLFVEGRWAGGFVKWFKYNKWQNGTFDSNTPALHREIGIYVGYTVPVWVRK